VLPYSAQPEALFSSKRWYLRPSERGAKTFEGTLLLPISQAKDHADTVVASSHDIPDRTAAEGLKGARIFVARSSFPTAAKDEYYWVDLMGLQVINRQQLLLGTVVDLMSTGPQTVLVVHEEATPKPIERMIPFVAAFVDDVDLPTRTIKVDWQPDF
jgi:16S rRNA processing protein RimM